MWVNYLTIAITLIPGVVFAATDKIVCYYGSWSIYRNSKGQFDAEKIDPFLCTHAIYTFVGINEDGSIRIIDHYNDIDRDGYKKFNELKKVNPNLKTLLAIGGWNEGSVKFSRVAASYERRQRLIADAVKFLSTYGFDGFDVDWEYPAQREGKPEDKANFATLLGEFRAEFDKHGYLLSSAVAAAAPSVDLSYDVPAVSKYLDIINVMAYDLHGSWETNTGQNSPMFPSSEDKTEYQKELNVVACLKTWLDRGAPREKIVLGMGVYGRSFTLSNSSRTGIGAPSTGPGLPGPYTQESGMLGYNEICEFLLYKSWTEAWNEEQQVPYAYSGNQWVGYDSQYSISLKVKYAMEQKLAGVMIWSVDTDDFLGSCGLKYAILGAIRATINNQSIPRPTPPPPTTPRPSTTANTNAPSGSTSLPNPGPGDDYQCRSVGYFRDPEDCSVFYYCQPDKDNFIKYKFNCPGGLVYNPASNACDYKAAVQC